MIMKEIETKLDLSEIKELVANPNNKIKLFDSLADLVESVLSNLDKENFSSEDNWSEEEFKRRVNEYEKIIDELSSIQVLISFWGSNINKQSLLFPFSQILGQANEIKSGKTMWLNMKWYPVLLLIYYSGISSLAAGKYSNLKKIFNLTVIDPNHSSRRLPLIQAAIAVKSDFEKPFKLVSGNDRHFYPFNEYLFQILSTKLKQVIHLNYEYERYFDHFEILMSLEYAHQTANESPDRVWGPLGRFAWKTRYSPNDPLSEIIKEGNTNKDSWAPIKAGLFNGNYKRFETISSLFLEKVTKHGGF